MDDLRLATDEVEHLRLRCNLWGAVNVAKDFGVPELDLLRAMIGLQAPRVVAIVRPKLAALIEEALEH